MEVGLTQNRETMTFWTLTTIDLLCFIMCEDLTCIKNHWNNIWLKARSHMTSHYTWGSMTTLRDFGGVLGQSLHTFFWALTISWSRLLAPVWSGPKYMKTNKFTTLRCTYQIKFSRFYADLHMTRQVTVLSRCSIKFQLSVSDSATADALLMNENTLMNGHFHALWRGVVVESPSIFMMEVF